jgi:protein-tyrosine kinase
MMSVPTALQHAVPLAQFLGQLPPAESDRARALALASPSRGEGTSTCTVQLARYLAESWQSRILMVDANGRHPSLHLIAGVEGDKGLTEVLRGDLEATSAMVPTSREGVFLLVNGARTDNPERLLGGYAIPGRLLWPLRGFDFVLFDCPPVIAYPDAGAVAASCHGTILVVEGGRTRRQAAQRAKALLEGAGAHVRGVLMNRRKFHIPQAIYDRL